jgi:hypothetical protein
MRYKVKYSVLVDKEFEIEIPDDVSVTDAAVIARGRINLRELPLAKVRDISVTTTND